LKSSPERNFSPVKLQKQHCFSSRFGVGCSGYRPLAGHTQDLWVFHTQELNRTGNPIPAKKCIGSGRVVLRFIRTKACQAAFGLKDQQPFLIGVPAPRPLDYPLEE